MRRCAATRATACASALHASRSLGAHIMCSTHATRVSHAHTPRYPGTCVAHVHALAQVEVPQPAGAPGSDFSQACVCDGAGAQARVAAKCEGLQHWQGAQAAQQAGCDVLSCMCGVWWLVAGERWLVYGVRCVVCVVSGGW
jgi:hypothetical protein